MFSLLNDLSQNIVIEKASQMAVSTYCVIFTMWLCKTRRAPRGTIYWLPTKGSVQDFVGTKVDPFINENQELVKSIDKTHKFNMGLKFLYGIPTYWRGLESKSGVKTISADAAMYDEFDEADQSQVAQARKRLSGGDIRIERELSTPTIPDFGINKRFQESDQHYFALKCPSCSRYQVLEQEFPNCFKQNKHGEYYLACKHCAKPLDIKDGYWCAMNPKHPTRGYHISQLYSPFLKPDDIMREYYTTEFMGHFYNHVIGEPYLSATDKVTEAHVLNLCDPTLKMPDVSQTGTFMGVDQGAKLHVTIMRSGTKPQVIAAIETDSFDQVAYLIRRYNVRDCVIDALPETRKARELQQKFTNKVWLCFYNDNQKGSYAWDEEKGIVQVNRTESLDAGTNAILEQKLSFFRREKIMEMFAKHCSNTAKVVEEDPETGSKKYVYKKLGPDHFRHSLNYAMIAMSRNKSGPAFSVFR